MEHLPPDEYRLFEEEIQSRDEYERQTKQKDTKGQVGKLQSGKSSKEESKESMGGSSKDSTDSESSFDFYNAAADRKEGNKK